jgi:hypothetical protein
VLYLPEFLSWCKQQQLPNPYIGIVTRPEYYNIRALPAPIKDAIKEKLSSSLLENVVKYMNSKDLSNEFANTINMITLLDTQRSQNFNETFPELSQLLKEAGCQI